MLMIPARLGRSESFWAVAKVRSPHTGPGIRYIIKLVGQGGATLASPRPDTGRSPTAFKVQALARCTWVSSLPLPPDKPTPAHTQSHSGHRMTPNDSLCVLRQNLRRHPKRAVPRLWCLLKALEITWSYVGTHTGDGIQGGDKGGSERNNTPASSDGICEILQKDRRDEGGASVELWMHIGKPK